ncbi:MAG: hypothetical protein J0H67_05055 [Rhodospirillales bacterium]|nr:hypothetical protein [Rhodospirillales bacterium]
MKSDVLAAIGEAGLQQPAAVNAALAANDRIKYVFTLLQMAASHADQPEQPAPLLRRERLACGIQDPALDDLPAATSRTGARYHIPGLPALLRRIAADLRLMAAPVAVIDPAIQPRLDALLAALPAAEDETLDPATLAAITQARPDADSLHRLVMDLHRALNALQATLAEERIDGAAAYGLAPEDRPRVAAFMAGLNRTAPLKFDHPGLATSATRQGQRLVVQNDIGTTDAHVVVVHIEGLAVTVTYTDVHPERLRFFQDMLSGHPVTWTVSQSGQLGGTPFHMATGRLDAADETACRAFLTTLGARLVFLIDWNRARRQLRAFLPGGPRVALLRWAAEQEVGHRGFLALGGAKLVNEAIEAAAGSAMHFGDRLSDVLGVAETEAFLRFVLTGATGCLRQRRSVSLLRDRIRAELARHFSNEQTRLIGLAADHAGLVFELASLARDGALAMAEAGLDRQQARAADYERDADRLVNEVRAAVRRRPDHAGFVPLMHAADDAADELEEAVFLLAQFTARLPAPVLDRLQALAALVVEAAQEWVKALLGAAEPAPEDQDDALVAIDRVLALEHLADDAERALSAAAVRDSVDFRQLHLCTALGTRLEEAADAMKRGALLLRDRLMEASGG